MKFSVAITTWNRAGEVPNALRVPQCSELVSEIIIADDASDKPGQIDDLYALQKLYPKTHVNFYHEHRGALGNKIRAVASCHEDWVVLLDSDNELNDEYLMLMRDAVEADKDCRTIYCPAEAQYAFNFRVFAGQTFNRSGVKSLLYHNQMKHLLNIGNYVLPRENWLTATHGCGQIDVAGSDVLYTNFKWLGYGGLLKVVPGATYNHAVHGDSLWHKTAEASCAVADNIYEAMEKQWL